MMPLVACKVPAATHRYTHDHNTQGPGHWSSAVWFRGHSWANDGDGWNLKTILLDDESMANRFILFVIVFNTILFAMQVSSYSSTKPQTNTTTAAPKN